MEENSFNCLDSQKGFNLQNIKNLLDGNKNKDYDLITRFYIELVLLSEVIDNTYNNPKEKREIGFYLNNKEEIEIPFKGLTYVKFDGLQIKYITGEQNFLDKKTDSIDNLFYDRGKKELMDIDINEYEELDIDELYFHTKKPKQAENIRVPVDSYKISNRKLEDLNPDKNEKPIGVKYLCKKINDKKIIFYTDSEGFIRSIRRLTDKEEEITNVTQKSQTSLIYKNGKKIKELNNSSFIRISLERGFIYHNGKKISTNTLFYDKDLKVEIISKCNKEKDKGIVFYDKKEIYLFDNIVVFKSTTKKNKGKNKAIFMKNEKNGKSKHSKNIIPEIFNSFEEGYNRIKYDIKLMSDKLPLNEEYTILYKGKLEEIEKTIKIDSLCDIHNIYKKYHINMKSGVKISILQLEKNQNLKKIELEGNMILMEEPPKDKKIECNYLKILFRLRNSIAHGQFKILEKKVIFCNEDKGKTMLRGSIFRDNIEDFLEELRENTLNMQLLESE